jgi:DNA-binding transcriptional regulator YhcF (GntR family)
MITTKQFQVGEVLPSTRELGQQLEASFHTVRKAYHILREEGMLRSEQGRGFIVERQTTRLNKSERLEIGARKMRGMLEELIGYGLDEKEIDLVYNEQLQYLEWPDRIETCASVGETDELGGMLAEAIERQVGVKSRVINEDQFNKAINYDALFVPIQLLSKFKSLSESGLLLPIVYGFSSDVLLSMVDRAGMDTIGLVTGEEESISKLISNLKSALNFEGSFLAGSVYGKSLPLFVRETDLIIYTPNSAPMVEAKIPEKSRLRLAYEIAPKSAETIRSELWDQ